MGQAELDRKYPFIKYETGQRWIKKGLPKAKRIKYCPGSLTHEPYLQPHYHPLMDANRWSAEPYPRSMWNEVLWFLWQHGEQPFLRIAAHIYQTNSPEYLAPTDKHVLHCVLDKLERDGTATQTRTAGSYRITKKLERMLEA